MPSIPELFGLARSLAIYYGTLPFRAHRMLALYRPFIRPGDLCFDLGAHAGNRVWAFARLGAHVVAVEPQPAFASLLRRLYGHRPDVTIIEAAVGASPGDATMHVSRAFPTVTTLSAEWMDSVRRTKSFGGVRWEQELSVRVTTLDGLIAEHSVPAFCKIDVEGYELECLRGLSQPVPALSIEYIPAAIDIALGCIERLAALGDYRFNLTRRESQRLDLSEWIDGPHMADRLRALSVNPGTGVNAPSGDLFARAR